MHSSISVGHADDPTGGLISTRAGLVENEVT